jgi:hypothetical protein
VEGPVRIEGRPERRDYGDRRRGLSAESILHPSRKTVKEFQPGLMETVVKENSLSDEEVDALIAYIQSLP